MKNARRTCGFSTLLAGLDAWRKQAGAQMPAPNASHDPAKAGMAPGTGSRRYARAMALAETNRFRRRNGTGLSASRIALRLSIDPANHGRRK